MISESEIPECPEREVKSKRENIFVNEKTLEEYSVKIYEIDSYFYEHYEEKIQANKNGGKYTLFSNDIYSIEYFLVVEVDENDYPDKDLIFEKKKDKKLQKKTLVVNLLELIQPKKVMMQTMKLVEYKDLSVNLKTNN